MTRFFLHIYDILQQHRRAVFILLLAFLLLCIMAVISTDFEEDIAKFLPRNAESERAQMVYKRMASENRIAVFVGTKDTTQIADADSIEQALTFVGERISQRGFGRNLQIKVDEQQLSTTLDFVYRNIPYFLKESDYHYIDSLLEQKDFVYQQLLQDRQLLLMPYGSTMLQMLQYDPLQLFAPVVKRLQQFNVSEGFQLSDGFVFTRDSKRALLSFESPYGSSESRQNALLASALDSICEQTQDSFPTLSVTAVGPPLIAATNASQIKTDSLKAMSVASLLIILLLVWHYRRLSDILWIGISVAAGWLFAVAELFVFHDSLSIIVLGVGSVIIGIAVNYPLHYLDQLRETGNNRETLREMAAPLLIGNITTVAAFLCLVWLDAQAIRDLGAFGSLMLMGTILFVLVVLPQYAHPRGKNANARKQNTKQTSLQSIEESDRNQVMTPNTMKVKKRSVMHSSWALLALVVLTLVFGYFSLKTSFDSNLSHINYMTDSQRADMELLASSVQQPPLYVITEAPSMKEALEANEQTLAQLDTMKQVANVRSASDFIVSTQLQSQRVQQWEEKMKAWNLEEKFLQTCKQLKFRPQAFQPFMDVLAAKYEPKEAAHFSLLTDLLSPAFVQHEGKKVSFVNYVYTEQEETVKKNFPFAFSARDLSHQLVTLLNDSFNYVSFVCGFVVFVFLWLSFRRIELALMSFLPLAVGWIWILGMMNLLGVQFNIVNIILATFIFGQGDDYTIFITEGLIREHATGQPRLKSYGRSVFLSSMLMLIGIGCLIFSKHPALRSLSEVTLIGMGTVVCMAFWLPSMVFRWLTHGVQGAATTVYSGNSSAKQPTDNGQWITQPLPITLMRLVRSLISIAFFLTFMYFGALPYTWCYFHFGKNTERKKNSYHCLMQRFSNWVMHHIPGVTFSCDNNVGETFEKPAVVVCNHQSHLDIMSVLRLSKKMVIVTNNWTWHNPFYGLVIHHADFLPAANGMEKNLPKLRALYERGYSIVIFPEGTRSEDCRILRFHKGAFYLAHELGADIIPVYLHGAGYVLPKRDFMLRKGHIHVEVGKRIKLDNYSDCGQAANSQILDFTHRLRHHYQKHYAELCQQQEIESLLNYYEKLRDYYKI